MNKLLSYALIFTVLLTAVPQLTYDIPAQRFNPQGNVLVLLYHTFAETDEMTPDKYTLYTTKEKFEQDINDLIDNGLKPLSLENFYKNNYDAGQKYFVLTLDDGYLTNYTHAYPIVKKHEVYMDIFANTDNFHLSNHFTLEQAEEMESSGLVKIYSHLPQHELATGYTPDKLAGEIDRSFELLDKDLTQKRYKFLAYPEGAYNRSTYDTAKERGVRLQMIQVPTFESKEFCVRTSVSYDTDMRNVIETAVYN